MEISQEVKLREVLQRAEVRFAHAMWRGTPREQLEAGRAVQRAREALFAAVRVTGSTL